MSDRGSLAKSDIRAPLTKGRAARRPGIASRLSLALALLFPGFSDSMGKVRIGGVTISAAITVLLLGLMLLALLEQSSLSKRAFIGTSLILTAVIFTFAHTPLMTQSSLQQMSSMMVFGLGLTVFSALALNFCQYTLRSFEYFVRLSAIILLSLFLLTYFGPVLIGPRPAAISATVLLSALLSLQPSGRRLDRLLVPGMLILPLLTGSRMASVVVILLLIQHRRIWLQRLHYMRLFAPLIAGSLLVVFFISSPLSRRFDQGYSNLTILGFSFDSSGRANLWPLVYESWQQNFILGNGIGSASETVLEKFGLAHPHMEYLRLAHDYGLLLGAFLVGVVIWLTIASRRSCDPYRATIIAQTIGVVVLFVTENTLSYVFFMAPWSAYLGFALGSINRKANHTFHQGSLG